MKTISGMPGGVAPSPPTGVEPREPEAPAPAAAETTAPTTEQTGPASHKELDAAVAELRQQLRDLPGGEREVRLLFEQKDNSFIVEIRDKETGELIQKFPPENLLNPARGPADHLGTVVDRHS